LQWQFLVAGRRVLICLFVKPDPGFGGIGRIDGFCWLVSFQSFFYNIVIAGTHQGNPEKNRDDV